MSFKQRVSTGLIFAGTMTGVILISPLACAILFVLITGLCLYEFTGLVLIQDGSPMINQSRRTLSITIGISLPVAVLFNYLNGFYNWVDTTRDLAIPVALLLSSGLFLFELFAKSKNPFSNIGFSFLGLFYIGLPFSLIIELSLALPNQTGNLFILCILFMIWAGDTGAYILGSKIGRTKMFPRISPKKTWEGTCSGALLASSVGAGCNWIFTSIELELDQWIILGIICAVFGVLGDLVESMLKRSLGIKDSANTLPGHGGFLDRFDSLIFVMPFIALALLLGGFNYSKFI